MTVNDDILQRVPGPEWTWRDHYLTHNGRQMHYIEFLREGGSSRTAVMLHGMTAHGDAWRLVISQLRSVGRIICPDFRGHGFSDWTRDGYWLQNYAEDIIELTSAIGVPKFDLVGHSVGARVAMVMGGLIPERLRSVVLSDTGPVVSREGALRARSFGNTAQALSGYRNEDKLRAGLKEEHPEWDLDAIEVRLTRLYRRNWAGMLVHRGDNDVLWLLGRQGLVEVDAMWAGLRAIKCPTLVVRGLQSYLLDDEVAGRMRECLAESSYVELDNGHELPHVRPREQFGPALETFLAGC